MVPFPVDSHLSVSARVRSFLSIVGSNDSF